MIDPATHRVTAAASVGTNPGPLAFEPESRSLWVGNIDDESVTRIDLDPVRTGKTIAIGDRPTGLAAGGRRGLGDPPLQSGEPYVTARRIDPRFDSAGRPVRVESLPREDAPAWRWSAVAMGGALARPADAPGPGDRSQDRRRRSRPASPERGRGRRWAAVGGRSAGRRRVARSIHATGIAKPIPVAGRSRRHRARAPARSWVTLALDDEVARIDPETGIGAPTRSTWDGARPVSRSGAGAVWVANSGDGTVSRLDPRSGDVTDTIAVGASPQDVVVADGRVWVSVRPRTRDVQEREGRHGDGGDP